MKMQNSCKGRERGNYAMSTRTRREVSFKGSSCGGESQLRGSATYRGSVLYSQRYINHPGVCFFVVDTEGEREYHSIGSECESRATHRKVTINQNREGHGTSYSTRHDLHLAGASLDGRHEVGHGHPQIVVPVNRNCHVLDTPDNARPAGSIDRSMFTTHSLSVGYVNTCHARI